MDGRFFVLFILIAMLLYVGWRGVTNPDAAISTTSADLAQGEMLFDKHCSSCHMPKEGIPLKGPTLGFYGNEYRLTDRQLVETARGKTGHDGQDDENLPNLSDGQKKELNKLREEMRKTTRKLTGAQVRNIIAFLKKSWTSDAQIEHWMITHQPPE
jgi:mono/diheme cytochrome c family protein